MAKAVLSIKAGSGYDDVPWSRYQFPAQYLSRVQPAEGDFIIYYEPRRSSSDGRVRTGREVYFATARIAKIQPPSEAGGLYYAQIDNYVPFVNLVSVRLFLETRMKFSGGGVNPGTAQNAVRAIPDEEFELIVQAGMGPAIGAAKEEELGRTGLADPPHSFEHPVVQHLVNRRVREHAFALTVRNAYDSKCAVTGLRIINGGGRAEIEAAHIRPVDHDGPDLPQNGIALCRTAHWMFDRGLIGLRADGSFDVNTSKVPEDARRMLRQDGRLILPSDTALRPHPVFVDWHRTKRYEPKLQSVY